MEPKPIRRILVPTDFSSCAANAVDHALALARPLGAQVTLLHVYQLPAYVFPDGSAYVTPPDVAAEIVRSVDVGLAAARRKAEGRGVEVATRSAQGVPFQCILDATREFDLVVMGTHGHTGLRHIFLGSVAEKVVRQSPTPVLTVREKPPVL